MSAEGAEPQPPDRGAVWRRLGAPHEQHGSVNDPRTQAEFGVRWNEKWVYLGQGGAPQRVVLWNRYDFLGVFRIAADGSGVAEPFDSA